MLIFLDFDDVLFNTAKFKEDYFKLFKKRGVSKEIFEKCYYDPLDSRKTKTYSPISHVKRICQVVPLDYVEFEKDIRQFTSDTSQYVFQDVSRFLDNFSKKELYLISFSKTSFQKAKIFNSSIADCFNQIKIVSELKGVAIKEIIKSKSIGESSAIYFIDDRVEHLSDVKIKNPEITTIFFLRKEGRHRDKKNKYCDYAVTSMQEISKIINLKHKNAQVNK